MRRRSGDVPVQIRSRRFCGATYAVRLFHLKIPCNFSPDGRMRWEAPLAAFFVDRKG